MFSILSIEMFYLFPKSSTFVSQRQGCASSWTRRSVSDLLELPQGNWIVREQCRFPPVIMCLRKGLLFFLLFPLACTRIKYPYPFPWVWVTIFLATSLYNWASSSSHNISTLKMEVSQPTFCMLHVLPIWNFYYHNILLILSSWMACSHEVSSPKCCSQCTSIFNLLSCVNTLIQEWLPLLRSRSLHFLLTTRDGAWYWSQAVHIENGYSIITSYI